MLSSRQKSIVYSLIHHRYNKSLICDDVEYYFKEGHEFRKIFNEFNESELEEKILEAYPNLAENLFRCESCNNFELCDYTYNVRFHPNNDPWEDTLCYKVCSLCLNTDYQYCWRDANYHNVPEKWIASYHRHPKRSSFYNKVDFSNPKLLGLEIETFIQGDRKSIYNTAIEAESFHFTMAEEDSSLAATNGVEFIFKPCVLQDTDDENHPLRKTVEYLRTHKTLAWDAGRNYGMHISINANRLTRLHCAKFCYFINRNTQLCEIFAGRPECRWAEYLSGRLGNAGNLSPSKYLAARRDEKRVEVRIFRSSLFWPRVRRNLEFVDSVREYTKVASSQELNRESYIEFLNQQSNYKIYRNVREFLGLNNKKPVPRELALSQD